MPGPVKVLIRGIEASAHLLLILLRTTFRTALALLLVLTLGPLGVLAQALLDLCDQISKWDRTYWG